MPRPTRAILGPRLPFPSFQFPSPKRLGTGPRPTGLTLSWSHRTLLRFSSGARFRSRPINSSNNCAAEIMVLPPGGCSHQPWHPPTKNTSHSASEPTPRPTLKPKSLFQRGADKTKWPPPGHLPSMPCAHGDTPRPGRRWRRGFAGEGAGPPAPAGDKPGPGTDSAPACLFPPRSLRRSNRRGCRPLFTWRNSKLALGPLILPRNGENVLLSTWCPRCHLPVRETRASCVGAQTPFS